MAGGGMYSLPLGDGCVHAVSRSGTKEAVIITNVMMTTLHSGLEWPSTLTKWFHVHQLLHLQEHKRFYLAP